MEPDPTKRVRRGQGRTLDARSLTEGQGRGGSPGVAVDSAPTPYYPRMPGSNAQPQSTDGSNLSAPSVVGALPLRQRTAASGSMLAAEASGVHTTGDAVQSAERPLDGDTHARVAALSFVHQMRAASLSSMAEPWWPAPSAGGEVVAGQFAQAGTGMSGSAEPAGVREFADAGLTLAELTAMQQKTEQHMQQLQLQMQQAAATHERLTLPHPPHIDLRQIVGQLPAGVCPLPMPMHAAGAACGPFETLGSGGASCSGCPAPHPSYCPSSARPLEAAPSTRASAAQAAEAVVCEFCGRWVPEEALALANHMCAEFVPYNSEFLATGAEFALLISGVQHLPVEQLAAFLSVFPFARRVQHGASFSGFNGIFLLGPHGPMLAGALLALGRVRTIPLSQTAQWRCLHVQLAPMYATHPIAHAEQVLNRGLQRAALAAMGRGAAAAGRRDDTTCAGAGDLASTMPRALRAGDAPEHLASVLPHLGAATLVAGSDAVAAPADWRCSTCSNINFAFRDKCNRCSMQRAGLRSAGGTAAAERSICPHTVMLVRVPPQASEIDVAEAMSVFGEIAAGGIKFHKQHTKFKQQRRGRVAREGVVALHAFCRFVLAPSATLALQQSEVLIFAQPVLINPAFKRGTISSDTAGASSSSDPSSPLYSPQPAAWSSTHLALPGHALASSDHISDRTEDRRPGDSGHALAGGAGSSHAPLLAALQLTSEPRGRELSSGYMVSFLAVFFQALWFLDPLRQEVAALGRGKNSIVDGLYMLRSSLYGTAPPLALLRAAFAPRAIEAACTAVGCVLAASERFEAALGVLAEAGDEPLGACLEQHFRMKLMDMSVCSCGVATEPVHHTRWSNQIDVPACLAGETPRLTGHIPACYSPVCQVPSCGAAMRTERYLMHSMPRVLTLALAWRDSEAAAAPTDAKAESGPNPPAEAPQSTVRSSDPSIALPSSRMPIDGDTGDPSMPSGGQTLRGAATGASAAPALGAEREAVPQGPAAVVAMLQHVPLDLQVKDIFKNVTANVLASLRGMLCAAGTKHSGIFLDESRKTWRWFDDSDIVDLGSDWGRVIDRCLTLGQRPVQLFYVRRHA